MINVFTGEKPLHTHENLALEEFLECIGPEWEGSTDTITVIANATWKSAEIDLVCLLPRAIIVADFKDYGGNIKISENGPWQSDSGPVKGGSGARNPFTQVRRNKFAVLNWLKDRKLLKNCNLGHIAGAVIFARPVSISGDLGEQVGSWFYTIDTASCSKLLQALTSDSISITPQQMLEIAEGLGVTAYKRANNRPRIVDLERSRRDTSLAPRLVLTERQEELLTTIRNFLTSSEHQSFSVQGMTHTGKTHLLTLVTQEIIKLGRQPIILAPNTRIARRLTECQGIDCRSIYSHVFDRNAGKSQKTKVGNTGTTRTLTVYPPRSCQDPESCVYLIDDAHLIGNDQIILPDNSRYGSGCLFDDFLQFAAPKEFRRQIILVGDPYQLARGRRETMPLFGDLQRARELGSIEVRLQEMYVPPEKQALLDVAKQLVAAIDAKQFSQLEIHSGPGLDVIPRQAAIDQVEVAFQESMGNTWLIASTNPQVAQFNKWIRSKLLGKGAKQTVASGDLLEVYFGVEAEVDPFDTVAHTIATADRVKVEEAAPEAVSHAQALSGRAEPIVFFSREVSVRKGSDLVKLAISEEFLVAEKPELESDVAIALDVWQRAHPEQPISRVRYGYASTAHHAQGVRQPICFVRADWEGNRHTDGYFRWLYTAITRAEDRAILFNYEDLGPFDTALWKDSGAIETDRVAFGGGWHLPATRESTVALADARKLVVQGLLAPLGWQVAGVKLAQYQDEYQLRHPKLKDSTLKVSYDQSCKVTAIRVASAGADFALIATIAEALTANAVSDPLGSLIAKCLRKRATVSGLRILGAARDGDYRLTFVLAADADTRVSIEVNHDKEGNVSTVRPVKYTKQIALDRAANMFVEKGDGL
jgi:hypothetical protein